VSTFLLNSLNTHGQLLAKRWYRDVSMYTQLSNYYNKCVIFKKIDMEQYDIWPFPMNVNDNHWILMVSILGMYEHKH